MLVDGGCAAVNECMDRGKVDGLIALVASDASLAGILSDYLMECGQWVHPFKRYRLNVLDLCEVAHFGTPRAKAVARGVRAAVVVCGKVIARRRRLRICQPEFAPRAHWTQPVVPALREAEGDQQYRARVAGWSGRYALHVLGGVAHCVRLARRGIEGRDVPPDVAENARLHREVMVAEWRSVAPWVFKV